MLEKVPAPVGHALQGARAGMDKLIWAGAGADGPEVIEVTSSAFLDGGFLPPRFTADGEGLSPPLAWSGVPQGAAVVIIVIEDADSPTLAPFVHALVHGLPGADGSIADGALASESSRGSGVKLGKNTFRKAGYLPLDPPTGHGPHRYVFQVYALDRSPAMPDEPEKHDIVEALDGRVLARGRMIGLYERPG